MAVNSYITLANSNSTLSKRFKVVSMKTPELRTDNIRLAVDGSLDKSNGAIIAMFRYVIRTSRQVSDSNFGTLADLKTLFRLNSPNGTPSDKITLTDHLEGTHECVFIGDFDPDNLTTIIDGLNAHFIVPIQLQETTRVA